MGDIFSLGCQDCDYGVELRTEKQGGKTSTTG